MKQVFLVAVAISVTLSACQKKEEETPVSTVTEDSVSELRDDEKMVVDNAYANDNIEELLTIYDNADRAMQNYAAEKIDKWLAATEDAEKVDDLYWNYKKTNGVRLDLMDAQERLNPDRT